MDVSTKSPSFKSPPGYCCKSVNNKLELWQPHLDRVWKKTFLKNFSLISKLLILHLIHAQRRLILSQYWKENFPVFSEDYDIVKENILDPRGLRLNQWNKCFLVACLISLFIDPLFFYLPEVEKDMCLDANEPFKIALTVIRSILDMFYVIQIVIRFRTAYIAPSSRVLGRGELVIDFSMIRSRYLRKDFWLDLLAALPVPQVLMWVTIPIFNQSEMINTKISILFIIVFQFLLRLYLTFLFTSQISRATGVVVEAAWVGAVYNLMLFMLASHVLGSCWYLLAIERQGQCWQDICDLESLNCRYEFFDCHSKSAPGRAAWYESSNISILCGPNTEYYHYGILLDALANQITMSKFLNKYLYCLWWGLRNLSAIGQNLETSTFVGEIYFWIVISILGLLLFALLTRNMQTYLQSRNVRLEEWRLKRTDTEQWMRHRQLPHELKERVRKHGIYEWATTRGVDEGSILNDLPVDLRRDIKHHLCEDFVRRVSLFDQMDDHTVDAICERLKPTICTLGTCVVRESDPVNEMLFIIRGYLDSYTTDGGRTSFFNSCRIGAGDFCGEELLTWALDPRPTVILPSSTRTVTAISEVEAFALCSEDVRFVATQYRKLLSKKLRHTFRAHSHQWRTWAACFIQAAWFRYKRRKEASGLKAKEGNGLCSDERCPMDVGLVMYTSTLAKSSRRSGSNKGAYGLEQLSQLPKPVEPVFSE